MARISAKTIQAVDQVHVLDLATKMGHWIKPGGSYSIVWCPNPNHSEKTPDTGIKNSKGTFSCFGGGGCGAKGGALQYYSWAMFGEWDKKKNFIDSVKGICEIMNIPLEYEDGSVITSKNNQTDYVAKKRPEITPPKEPKECDQVYRRFLELCSIQNVHALEWAEKRQYTDQQVQAIGLKSVPNYYGGVQIIRTLLKEGYDLERIPGFTRKLRKDGNPQNLSDWYWTMNAYGKYFIPVRDENGYIVRLRIATSNPNRKYTWFSSEPNVKPQYSEGVFTGVEDVFPYRKEPLLLSKMEWGGCSSSHQINVVIPSNQLGIWTPGDAVEDIYNFDYVLVTEGEHKANIVSNFIQQLVIGVPGVGLYKEVLPLLRKWDVKKLVIAYDADAFIRKEDDQEQKKANDVFNNLIKFSKEILASDGIRLYFWIWNLSDGKGLDDLLITSKKIPIEVDVETRERKSCDFLIR